MDIRIATHGWVQVGGDMNPGAHGGTIATADGSAIELVQIQPKRAHVGDEEALDTGSPFWSRVAYFDLDDLRLDNKDVISARRSSDLTDERLRELKPESRAMAIAEALLDYGRGDEGPDGWAKDVIGDRRVLWWGGKRPVGWRYLEDEDREFRALLRERERDRR
jgi:hypothetical protein